MQTRPWLTVGLALTCAVPTHAQRAVDPALEALVAEALARSPELQAAGYSLAAAREGPEQAAALPDPMVAVALTNDGWGPSLGAMPDSNLAVMASQDLPPPRTRGLRRRIADSDVQAQEHRLARVRKSLEASVRRAYHSLAQSRLLLALAAEQADVWRQIEEVARARYAVGQGAQQDVLRVQVELTRAGQRRLEQEADEEVRLAALNRLAGRPLDAPVVTAPLAPAEGDGEPLSAALARLAEASPERAAARVAVDRARLQVELAKAQSGPGFTVQAAYMNRGGLDPMWQAAVGVTLPLRKGWRRAALAAAEEQARAAEARLRAAEALLEQRTRERLIQLESARKLWTLHADGIVPQDQMSVDAAIASYQAGKVPFLAVLEALATLYRDRAAQVQLQAGYARALASLEEGSLEPTSDVAAVAGGGMTGGMGSGAGFGPAPAGSGAAGAAMQDSSGGAMAPMGGRQETP